MDSVGDKREAEEPEGEGIQTDTEYRIICV